MKNLLFVSIAFPPKNDPESLQAAKYFKYLVREEVNIDVVTSQEPTLWMECDDKLKKYLHGLRQLVEIPIFEPKYLSILAIKQNIGVLRKPDTRMHFHLQWKKVVNELDSKPDVIYSRAFPLSSNIMALKLKKHYDIPWVLHLSDPWVDSPLAGYTSSGKRYHERLERECFALADKISFTSSHTIEAYKKKFPALEGKFIYCPNVYDDDDIVLQGLDAPKSDKMRFLYTGSLNGSRSVKYLEEAIAKLEVENRKILDEIEFIFAGSLDRENLAYFDKNERLEHIGLVSFEDVKELQRNSDVLIAIDFLFDDANDAVFFPSKILDYLITGNPIMAITNKNSMTQEVVDNFYGSCFSHRETSAIARQILTYYEEWKNGELRRSFDETDLRYSAKENAKKLFEVVQEL